jgi:hypothetical protein
VLRFVPHLTAFCTTMIACLKSPRDLNTSNVSTRSRGESAVARIVANLRSLVSAVRSPIATVLRGAIKGPDDSEEEDNVITTGAVMFPIHVSVKGTISS